MLEVANILLIPKKMARLPFLGLSSGFKVQNELVIPQKWLDFFLQGCVVVLEVKNEL